MFTKDFDRYAVAGETISCEVDGFTVVARIEHDSDAGAPDTNDEGFWPSLDKDNAGYIGLLDGETAGAQQLRYEADLKRMQHVMASWKDDIWFYCGIVLTVKKGTVVITDHAASLWCVDCNYPDESATDEKYPNQHLREVANDLLDDALADAKAQLPGVRDKYLKVIAMLAEV